MIQFRPTAFHFSPLLLFLQLLFHVHRQPLDALRCAFHTIRAIF
jgi:hypothetical protein